MFRHHIRLWDRMTENDANHDDVNDNPAKPIVVKAYVQFCVERKMLPSKEAAESFAVMVTESGGRKYHDLTGDDLVQMLCAPGALES